MASLEARFETADGWHRVHWFRLVELLGRAAFASIALLATGVPNGIGAWAEEAIGLLFGLQAVISYFSTRYRITSTAVTTTKGVVFRSEDTMRRDDVQTVTVHHPVWLRPLRLATATVADDAGNEIEIGPVTRAVADGFAAALQTDHLASPGGDLHTGEASERGDARDPERLTRSSAHLGSAEPTPVRTHRVDAPIWKLAIVSVGNFGFPIAIAVGLALISFGYWGAAIIVTIIWLQVTIAEVVGALRFRLTVSGDEICTREGLLSLSESRTTRERSEYLLVDEPLAFRLVGLERAFLGNADDVVSVSPAQPRGRWRQTAEALLGVAVPEESVLTPISDRSVRRFQLIGAALATAMGILASVVDWRVGLAAAAVTAIATVGWYPRARLARFAIGGDERSVLTRSGFAPRRTRLYRVDRIDASALSSVPAQRRAGLATLRFSGRAPNSDVRIPDLDATFAGEWEKLIATRIAAPKRGNHLAKAPDPVDVVRRDVPLPRAALPASLLGGGSAVALSVVIWAVLIIASRMTDPPDSLWRQSWLVWGGTALVLANAVATIGLRWMRVKVERWSLTNRTVERRFGIILRRRTSLKRSYVSAATWSQGPVERRFGLGTVVLKSRGVTNPDVALQRLTERDVRYLADLHRSSSPRLATHSTPSHQYPEHQYPEHRLPGHQRQGIQRGD